MSLQIAETKFITKSSSGLAAVDVYGQSPTKEAKNAGSILSGIGAGFNTPNTAGKINSIVDGLTKALENTKGKSFEDQMKAIKAVVGGKDALLKDFKNSIVSDVLTNVGFGANAKEIAGVLVGDRDPSNLLSALGKTNPQMKIVVNGIQTVMSAKDLDTAQGIGNLLGKLSGNSELVKVFDLQPEAMLLKSLLDKATMFRIPALVDSILDSTDSDEQKTSLLVASTPKAAFHSDLNTITKAMDKIGDANTLRTHPTLITDILGNFVPVSGEAATPADGVLLREVLDRLQPEWWLTDRGGRRVYNLDMFYNLSVDAYSVLSVMEDVKIPVVLSGLYPVSDLEDIKIKTRPWAVL